MDHEAKQQIYEIAKKHGGWLEGTTWYFPTPWDKERFEAEWQQWRKDRKK